MESRVPPRVSLVADSASELAVGIDLGTTYSLVAHLDSTGRPWTVLNAEGDITTPFGGFKQSGFGGRDKSIAAHEQYTETKTIWLDLS